MHRHIEFQTQNDGFDATLASVLEQLPMENKLVYLMRDYNID